MMEGIRRSSETMGLQEEPATKIEAPVEAAVHVEADDATSNAPRSRIGVGGHCQLKQTARGGASGGGRRGAAVQARDPEPVEKAAVAVAAIKEVGAARTALRR